MKLLVLAIGRLKGDCERRMAGEYLKRAAPLLRRMGFSSVEMREFPESRAASAARRKAEEAEALRKAAGKGAVFIALDERGENIGSRDFSARLKKLGASGAPALAVLIGGPDGLDADLRARARLVLSFGALTWPHRLARIMAAEQLYRAATIAAGHPYHRD